MRTVARLLLCLSALLWPATTFAEPPPVGSKNIDVSPSVVCDTIDQIKKIAASDDLPAAFIEFFNLKNRFGDPTCTFSTVKIHEILNVIDIGVIRQEGTTFHAWAIDISQPGVSLWLLYGEQITTTLPEQLQL